MQHQMGHAIMSGMFSFVTLTDADWDRGWVRVPASSLSTAEVGDLAILIDNTSGHLVEGRVELIAYGDAVGEVGITVELLTRMGPVTAEAARRAASTKDPPVDKHA